MASLCYTPHGGSGFTFTRKCVHDMEVHEATFYLEWLEEQRDREGAAMRAASRRK